MNPTDGSPEISAAQWLSQGQAAEAIANLTEALRCYDQAIASLRAQSSERVRRDLAIAAMNRGNALQKLNTSQAIADAVRTYDEAIALLGAVTEVGADDANATAATQANALGAPDANAVGAAGANALGAAWMNRGHAWQRLGTPEALAEAVNSYDRAINVLTVLPLDEDRSCRINLAAAAMNRANALLSFPLPKANAARGSAAVALTVAIGTERADPVMADIALKARHALCAALAHLLASADTPGAAAILVTETGDTVDEALSLVRHWEQQGVPTFRRLAIALYRFGAQFYLVHQPKFLPEFLLETLDPARSAGAMPGCTELHAIAAEALARALADTYNRSLAMPDGAQAAGLLQLRQELTAAESRRATLVPARQ